MGKISIKGIVIGGVVDITVSFLLGLLLGISIAASVHQRPISHAEESAALVAALHEAKWVYLAFGLISSMLGGYIAARIAKQDALLNGALSSCLCLVVGVITLARGASIYPYWAQFVIMLASIACAALGGYLWILHSRTGRRSPTPRS